MNIKITTLPEYCVCVIMSKVPLQERLYIRSVCTQWNTIINSMCLSVRASKFILVSTNRFRSLKIFLLECYESIRKGIHPSKPKVNDLVLSINCLSEQMCFNLSNRLPNLDHLSINIEPYCSPDCMIKLLLQFPHVAGLSLYGKIEPFESCVPEKHHPMIHRLLAIINSMQNLKSLNLEATDLFYFCNRKYCQLSHILSKVLPFLERFSIAHYDKSLAPVLAKLGPQCVQLKIVQCRLFDQTNLEFLQSPQTVTHLFIECHEEFLCKNELLYDANTLASLIADRFNSLQMLHLNCNCSIDLDLSTLRELNKLTNLNTLILHNFYLIVDINDAGTVKQLAPLSQVKIIQIEEFYFYYNDCYDYHLEDIDLFCKTLASIFPEIEKFIYSDKSGIKKKNLIHFTKLRKHLAQ